MLGGFQRSVTAGSIDMSVLLVVGAVGVMAVGHMVLSRRHRG